VQPATTALRALADILSKIALREELDDEESEDLAPLVRSDIVRGRRDGGVWREPVLR
jgi:hypothetical protein